MKPVIAFVATFVIAMAASTGASFAMHRGSPHPADSLATASDSAAHDSTGGDSASLGGRDSAAHRDSSPSRPLTATPGAPAVATLPGAAPKVGVPAAKPGSDTPSADSTANAGKRLAKLFAAMDPADAVKSLQHFSDADAQMILAYVGAKQAAPILALMPPERVAALGKAALHGRGQ